MLTALDSSRAGEAAREKPEQMSGEGGAPRRGITRARVRGGGRVCHAQGAASRRGRGSVRFYRTGWVRSGSHGPDHVRPCRASGPWKFIPDEAGGHGRVPCSDGIGSDNCHSDAVLSGSGRAVGGWGRRGQSRGRGTAVQVNACGTRPSL